MRTLADRLEHVLTCFLEFCALFVQSHLLINYRISSSKNLPAIACQSEARFFVRISQLDSSAVFSNAIY